MRRARLQDGRLRLAAAIAIPTALVGTLMIGIGASPDADAPPGSDQLTGASGAGYRPGLDAPAVVSASGGAAARPGVGSAAAAPLPRATPEAIRIPAIGVDTGIVGLGLNPDGTMEVPSRAQEDMAGWYRYLASPGEAGPAVIAGHVYSPGGPAVFTSLATLRAGDSIAVDRADGTTATFTVQGVRAYARQDFPTEAVYGPVDGAALRLVTCGGRYDWDTHQYPDRVVAYAGLTDATAHQPLRSSYAR